MLLSPARPRVSSGSASKPEYKFANLSYLAFMD